MLCRNFLSIKCPGCSTHFSSLKGKFHSKKCFAMYTAPTEKYWPEIIAETCFYKVDGVTYYGHSLKGTNGL